MGNFPKLTLVYDGECNLCLAAVDKIKSMKVRANVTFVPLQALVNGKLQPWPGIADVPLDELAGQMHVTDESGRRHSGSDGVLLLLRHVPSLAWLGVLGNIPGLRGISRLAYRIVARNRYRLFGRASCSDGVCSLPRGNQTNLQDGGAPPHDERR
ncbi:thiol-disulfide oxidoreductase DCC family protein [Cohnella faecalis]|nr:DUF393 domain-containing protein [Cohnella faecalis]